MSKRGTKIYDYAQERAKWLELLVGDDRNSIRRQLSAVAWDLASFETIGEAIRLARREGDNSPKVPPLIVNLLRVGFYANLFVSIRRLVDPRGDVSSLTRILKEMKRKSGCINRKAMLSAEGIPYDYLPAKQEQELLLRQAILEKAGGLNVPPHLDWELFAARHEVIDRLTGTTEKRRLESDHIPRHLFDNLISWVEKVAKQATDYANQFVAHASEPESPSRSNVENVSISHGNLVECYKCLCNVYNFIRCEILGVGRGLTSLKFLYQAL